MPTRVILDRGQTQAVSYDLIGDIHGYSEPLVELLDKFGYRQSKGIYRHAERKAVFVGDFIDRGPNQREVIEIVRPMIDEGAALSVMGNHEFNAIAWFTEDPENSGEYLREHSSKHRRQHQAFLDAYEGADDYADLIEWFRTLPMWLELPGLRVVHACWDDALMQDLEACFPSINQYLDENLLLRASRKNRSEHAAIETLLKGKEIELPKGHMFYDKDGHARHEVRVRWFDGDAQTYHEAFLGPEKARSHIPEDPIGADHLLQYSHEDPPVFIGHYWLDTEPEPLACNIACLDYSVAAEGGKLVGYRWDGEQALRKDKFVCVERAS